MYTLIYLILISFASSLWSAPNKEVEDAKKSILALIRPLVPGSAQHKPKMLESFRVDQCEKHKLDWMDLLMMRSKVTLKYRFELGCDIQGDIAPKVLQSFPATLALRHLDSYDKVEVQNKITASLESRPIVNLEMRSGILSGKKGKVKFEADYQLRINPVPGQDPVDKNLGGEIRINEIHGKKVSIKEKILVQ